MFFGGFIEDACAVCGNEITQNINTRDAEANYTVYLGHLTCPENNGKAHKAHKGCLDKACAQFLGSGAHAECIDCKKVITDEKVIADYKHVQANIQMIIKTSLFVKETEKFASIISKKIFSDFSDELIKVYKTYKCKQCTKFTTLKRGEVDYTLKDRYNKTVSSDAAINCNLNKIQCDHCNYNFCNKCKIEPYHVGYTCELY